MKNDFQLLIEEICDELNIKYTYLSRNWIIMLDNGQKTRFIEGYKFDVNNQAVGALVDDKYALYTALKEKNNPVIEYNILFNKNNDNDYAKNYNDYDAVHQYFKKHQKIVIKPNLGTCGNGVTLIQNEEDIDTTIEKLLTKNFSINYSQFYNIETEYRVIILKNKIKLIYGKKRPIIVGNNKNTVKELLELFNPNYFKNENKFFNKKIDINYIPKENEIIEYNWQFNLSKGSQVIEADQNTINILTPIALKAMKDIDLTFGSVDIIKTTDNQYKIIEINSGVMMINAINLLQNGNKIAKSVYKEAIIEMFNKN